MKVDPFKYTVYKIMGRCDLQKKTLPDIVFVVEDYLWLQLMLISENNSGTANYDYDLYDLQHAILQFAQNILDGWQSYTSRKI